MIFIRVRDRDTTIYLNVNQETTSLQIKRMLKQFTNRKIKDMRLLLPRNLNRQFNNEDTIKKFLISDGENVLLQLRNTATNKFPKRPSIILKYSKMFTNLMIYLCSTLNNKLIFKMKNVSLIKQSDNIMHSGSNFKNLMYESCDIIAIHSPVGIL